MMNTVCLPLFGHHCSDTIVRTPLFGHHCSDTIVRTPLFGHHIVGINTKMRWGDVLGGTP
jgi:hypothetical protein